MFVYVFVKCYNRIFSSVFFSFSDFFFRLRKQNHLFFFSLTISSPLLLLLSFVRASSLSLFVCFSFLLLRLFAPLFLDILQFSYSSLPNHLSLPLLQLLLLLFFFFLGALCIRFDGWWFFFYFNFNFYFAAWCVPTSFEPRRSVLLLLLTHANLTSSFCESHGGWRNFELAHAQ